MPTVRQADPSVELESGPLAGWEICIKLVTNGCGQMAVVGQDPAQPLFGPTSDMDAIAAWLEDYMLDE